MHGLTLAFDLDGTLVDTAPDLVRAANVVLTGEGYERVPGEVIRPYVSLGSRAMIERGLAHQGIRLPTNEIDRLFKVFIDAYQADIAAESRPYPSLLPVLDRLAGAGARLAVCTNKRTDLSLQLLDELELTPRFAAICGRDSFPACKPDAGHLTGTIVAAGGDIARAVMVGDSATDVATARNARLPVIGVSFGYSDTPMRDLAPDVLIDHYDELEAALAHILSRT